MNHVPLRQNSDVRGATIARMVRMAQTSYNLAVVHRNSDAGSVSVIDESTPSTEKRDETKSPKPFVGIEF